jgi:ankyrin repeat protein
MTADAMASTDTSGETDPEHRTADLCAATMAGDADRVRALLDERPELVRAHAPDGSTVLHLAAWKGHAKVAEVLLARGADPSVATTNSLAVRPLGTAAASGHAVIAHLLLDRGADVDATQAGGITPLHAAAANDDRQLVSLLLDRGADPALVTDDGRTAAQLTTDADVAALLP